jgi:hypothetical protein
MINAGHGTELLTRSWNPLSHEAYWADKDVLGPLVSMLEGLLPASDRMEA